MRNIEYKQILKKRHLNSLLLFIILLGINKSFAQESRDEVTPQQTPFNTGNSIDGWVQGSVNEPTGKVNFSIPLTSIGSRDVSYSVALGYNGQIAFDQGQYTNKYAPTSSVGVGFSLAIPKIVVDNKGTATKEDDTFYLQDGSVNSKLFCSSKYIPTTPGNEIWSFKSEKHSNHKIEYIPARHEIRVGQLMRFSVDQWVITTSEGIKYTYGAENNDRENMVAWGNWIGSSMETGGSKETIVWNVSKIKDQWNNHLNFEYEKQESSIGGIAQTEASYIKKIVSSTGEILEFTYANKVNEYYEPHTEVSEPDAYQERYEKRFLDYISAYNSNDDLMYTYDLTYFVEENNGSNDKKRYLQSIVQQNANGDFLPGQSFEYYLSGDFKGGIKKINYPLGGSATYKYKNQYLFTNSGNRYSGSRVSNDGYEYVSMVVKNKYSLKFLRSNETEGGKHTFKIIRSFWNGSSWKENEFIFRKKMPYWFNDLRSVFSEDFYGFIYKDGSNVTLDLFHLESDGHTWDHYQRSNIFTGGDMPSFLKGEKFVAIGTLREGPLYTYTWLSNKDLWDARTIQQDFGWYRYGATNNYIVTLDTDGKRDPNGPPIKLDQYAFHYLSIEENNTDPKWVSRDWTSFLRGKINQTDKDRPNNWFSSNSYVGFVGENNPELFIRWNKDYSPIEPDDVLGRFNDNLSMTTTYTGMALMNGRTLKPARFNGVSWTVGENFPLVATYPGNAIGIDKIQYDQDRSHEPVGYAVYDPNFNTWRRNDAYTQKNRFAPREVHAINSEFMIHGNNVSLFTNDDQFPTLDHTFSLENLFCYSDGTNHGFVDLGTIEDLGGAASIDKVKGLYLSIDKRNNSLQKTYFNDEYNMSGPRSFAGITPFLSRTSMWLRSASYTNEDENYVFNNYLYRIINNKTKQAVYDKVIEWIEIDNNEGEIRKTKYTYSDAQPTPDNSVTFYGQVTVDNKGYGTASVGKIISKYNNGSKDQRLAGLLLEKTTKNTANNTVAYQKNNWRVINNNGVTKLYNDGQESETFFNNNSISNSNTVSYNSTYHLPNKREQKNSSGQIEKQTTSFAHDQYDFMKDNNFIGTPYEIKSYVDNNLVSVSRTIWKQDDNNKIYPYQTWSGPSTESLRLSSEITRMNTHGQVEESNNGLGQYQVVIYGYNYRYPIASISNARYNDVINNLDVTVQALQTLNNASLKTELSKLYSKLPNAMIEVSIYDIEGKLLEKLDNRRESSNFFYDEFDRLDYSTDHNNKVVKKNIYNYKSE